jgi:predicted phosphate transport protein (TIGR00153 family)
VRVQIFPREERFFDLFVEDAENVLTGARRLEQMLRSYADREQAAKELFAIEHHGDELSHSIGRRLNTTFVTPFDREDIHALISSLDDVLDLIEEVADTFILYNIESPTAAALQQAGIIVKQCELLNEALKRLRGFSGLDEYWIEVHRLENEGDRVARAAVAELFSNERMKPTDVIKWKDVYALLESCIDKCEDVANILERIVVKQA